MAISESVPHSPPTATTAAADSTIYNFDGQANLPALVPGEVYQWRVWADKGPQVDSFVEELISSSEDLRGVFQMPEEPEVPEETP